MRIGIISFEESLNSKTLRGVSTTTRYFRQDLITAGIDVVDIIVYGKGKKYNYPREFHIHNYINNIEDLKKLKYEYDFIVYFTPGRSWEKYDENDPDRYHDILDAIGIPFTFIYHSEEYAVHHPYRLNFLNHDDCKFLTFIVEGFCDIYKYDLSIVPNYVVTGMLPPLSPLSWIKYLKKSDSVVITSAWTNFKRNLEYFELVPEFINRGITPYSAGSPNSNFYMNDILDKVIKKIELVSIESPQTNLSLSKYKDYKVMMSRLYQDIPEVDNNHQVIGAYLVDKNDNKWFDYGAYYPADMYDILKDKKFHWNMSCYKVNKKYIPKFETVTLEAFNHGCLPIICKETTPDWVPDDSAIRFSKYDYADQLDILKDMSEEERILRLERFYELISTNLHNKMFTSFKLKIKEVIE